jgi:hypothetical protein
MANTPAPSNQPVPRITLPTCPSDDTLFFDAPEPDLDVYGIGGEDEESEDDEDEIIPIFEENIRGSLCPSINHEDSAREDYHFVTNVAANPTDNFELAALRKYCPFNLTYVDRGCPLGEDCTLEQICCRNSHWKGCSREPCIYSHEFRVTCPVLLKKGHCNRPVCVRNHEFELRNTIRESIQDHEEHRLFGAKAKVVKEEDSLVGSSEKQTSNEDVQEIIRAQAQLSITPAI